MCEWPTTRPVRFPGLCFDRAISFFSPARGVDVHAKLAPHSASPRRANFLTVRALGPSKSSELSMQKFARPPVG